MNKKIMSVTMSAVMVLSSLAYTTPAFAAEDVKTEVTQAVEKAEEKALEVKDAAVEKATEVKEAVEEKATEVKEAVEEKVEEVKEAVEEEAVENVIVIRINGEVLNFEDQEPIIKDNRTLLPVRAILEAIGAEVEWDAEARTVTATTEEDTIVLTIDSTTALVNEEEVELDVPAQIINNRTMVPVRFVSENFGYTVDFDNETEGLYLIDIYNITEAELEEAIAANATETEEATTEEATEETETTTEETATTTEETATTETTTEAAAE